MSLLLAMMLQAVAAPPPVDTAALQAQLQSARTDAASAKTAADAAATQAATAIANAAAASSAATTAATTATTANSKAENAAATAALACPPGSILPKMESVTPSAGIAMTCVRSDFVPMRISRTVSGVTATGGNGTVTWPVMPSPPKLTVTPYVAAGALQAPLCFPVTGTVTTTGATIRCFSTQTVTVSILGAVIAPITTAAAGVMFDVLALPAS